MPVNKELNEIIESNAPILERITRLRKLLLSDPTIDINEPYGPEDGPKEGYSPSTWLLKDPDGLEEYEKIIKYNDSLQLASELFKFGPNVTIYPKNIDFPKLLEVTRKFYSEYPLELSPEHPDIENAQKAYDFLKYNLGNLSYFFASILYQDPNQLDTAPENIKFNNTHLMSWLINENYGSFKSVIYLHAKSIDPNLFDNQHKTVLCLAAKMYRPKEVLYLLNQFKGRINVNVPDNLGNTPLHYAYAYGNEIMIKALLEQGANPNFKNKKDQLPKDMIGTSKEEVMSFLESVSIEPKRDINADSDMPIYIKLGESLEYQTEEPINSIEYIDKVLENPELPVYIRNTLLASRAELANVSIIEKIMKDKLLLSPTQSLLISEYGSERKTASEPDSSPSDKPKPQ